VDIPIPTIAQGNIVRVDEALIRKVFPRGIQAVADDIAKSAGHWAASI
jgi:hypothetical protein